jgi:1,2-phenylacetyl-CoA epoxidase PaaB subunit
MRKRIDRQLDLNGQTPTYYEVFARRDSADALTHVGSVDAPNVDLAVARAWYVYDHHQWSEMCLVPTAAVVPVTGHGPASGDVFPLGAM